jgi:hypothetical protein
MKLSINKKILYKLDLSRSVKDNDRYLTAFDKLINNLDSLDKTLDRVYSCKIYYDDVCVTADSVSKNTKFLDYTDGPATIYSTFDLVKLERPDFNFKHEYWHELSNRILFVTETHSHIFYYKHQLQVAALHERLRELRIELRKRNSKWILDEIRDLVSEIRRLAIKIFLDSKYRRRGFSKKMISFKRNLRLIYRWIIQFLFKNLDDESGDTDNVMTADAVSKTLSMNLNWIKNVQQKGKTKMGRHYKFYPGF